VHVEEYDVGRALQDHLNRGFDFISFTNDVHGVGDLGADA